MRAAWVVVLLPVCWATRHLCSVCECLPRSPDVDCRNRELRQIPLDLAEDGEGLAEPWVLELSNNMISNITQFPPVAGLSILRLRHNYPTQLVDGAFSQLANLTSLDLSNNGLTPDKLRQDLFKGEVSSSFQLGLDVLDVSYNNLTSLGRTTFQHLHKLRRLVLAHNPIRDISMETGAAINELDGLVELDLSQTQLDRLPNHFLSDFRELEVLILAGNNFKTVSPEVNYAPRLKHLNLNANPIEVIRTDDLTIFLSELTTLELSSMPVLRAVQRHAFSSLSNLQVLHLSDNPSLLELDPEAFYEMAPGDIKLKELYLQDNQLTGLQENMMPWTELQYVNVQNNPWNCDCNLRWMAEKLIPDLEKKNPWLTLSLLCAQPTAAKGKPLSEVLGMKDGFACQKYPYASTRGFYGTLAITTIIVGATMLLTGTLIFAYMLYARSRGMASFGNSIKYRRARDEEEDPSTIHS